MIDESIEILMENVSFAYEKNKYVLEDVNISINKGEYVGIIGDNGSAKSTLLKLMIGNLFSNSGRITILNQEIKKFNLWTKIGYLSQQVRNFNKKFPATVEEIVGTNLYSNKGVLKFLDKKDKKHIDEVLDMVNMSEFKNRLIGSLSGGQQQKVFIARLLVGFPEIIFMDEPLVGIDHSSSESIYDIIDTVNEKNGTTIVMVTHDIKEIFNRADKICCLNNKKVNVYSGIKTMCSRDKNEIIKHNLNIFID